MAALGAYAVMSPQGATFPVLLSSAILLFLLFRASAFIPGGNMPCVEERTRVHAFFAEMATLGMVTIAFNHPGLRDIFEPQTWMNVAATSATLVYMVLGVSEFFATLKATRQVR